MYRDIRIPSWQRSAYSSGAAAPRANQTRNRWSTASRPGDASHGSSHMGGRPASYSNSLYGPQESSASNGHSSSRHMSSCRNYSGSPNASMARRNTVNARRHDQEPQVSETTHITNKIFTELVGHENGYFPSNDQALYFANVTTQVAKSKLRHALGSANSNTGKPNPFFNNPEKNKFMSFLANDIQLYRKNGINNVGFNMNLQTAYAKVRKAFLEVYHLQNDQEFFPEDCRSADLVFEWFHPLNLVELYFNLCLLSYHNVPIVQQNNKQVTQGFWSNTLLHYKVRVNAMNFYKTHPYCKFVGHVPLLQAMALFSINKNLAQTLPNGRYVMCEYYNHNSSYTPPSSAHMTSSKSADLKMTDSSVSTQFDNRLPAGNSVSVTSEDSTEGTQNIRTLPISNEVLDWKEFFNISPEDKKGLPNDRVVECDEENGICFPSVFLNKNRPPADNEDDLLGYGSDDSSDYENYYENDVEPIYDNAVQRMRPKLTEWIDHYMKRFVHSSLHPKLKQLDPGILYEKFIFYRSDSKVPEAAIHQMNTAWNRRRSHGQHPIQTSKLLSVFKKIRADYINHKLQQYHRILIDSYEFVGTNIPWKHNPTGLFLQSVVKEVKDMGQFLIWLASCGSFEIEAIAKDNHLLSPMNFKARCPCHIRYQNMMENTIHLQRVVHGKKQDLANDHRLYSCLLCEKEYTDLGDLAAHCNEYSEFDAFHRLIPAFCNVMFNQKLIATEAQRATQKKKNKNKKKNKKKKNRDNSKNWIVNTEGGPKYFSSYSLFTRETKGLSFREKFSAENYLDTVQEIMDGGKKIDKGGQRGAPMYCYGTTTFGGGGLPKYVCPYTRSEPILPRPYTTYKPGGPGRKVVDSPWFKEMCKYALDLVWKHIEGVRKKDPDEANRIEKAVKDSMELIHPSLRIGNTPFTQAHAVGYHEWRRGCLKIHFDKGDICTLINSLGELSSGGSTMYYNGTSIKKDVGELSHETPFEHGRVQIGTFDTVIHGVSPYVGIRMVLNFNLKSDVLEHFRLHGDKFYIQYYNAGLPPGYFLAKLT